MAALDDAIKWKLNFIDEMIPVIRVSPSLTAPEKKQRIDDFEAERKILNGPDKAAAKRVVKANLERWIEAATASWRDARDPHESVSWRTIIDERQKLLNAL